MIIQYKQISVNAVARLLPAALLLPCMAFAHDRDSIAAKYSNEHAVYTTYTERLVITNESGKLEANSYVTMVKQIISDQGPAMHNRDYFFHGDFHKLMDVDATASIPTKTGGFKKVTCNNYADVSASDGSVFYDDVRAVVVSYSGLVKNATTETKYTLEHTDLNMLPRFLFQEDIPVAKMTYEVTVPKYVQMKFAIKGENTKWIKETTEERGNTVTYRFTATDVPAQKSYEHVPSSLYYVPHVIPYITSYKFEGQEKPVAMLSNPDELYKYLYKYIRSINMKEDTAINRIVDDLTKNDVTPRQKAAHIYQWVQKNLHYIAFEKGLEGYVPREASLICKRKYGDCKDMASMLVTMCRKAGLDAYFTWIGTRSLPYTNEETPLSLVNNHMIAALKVGDEWIFMDGTHALIPFGQNPDAIQGKEAMIAIDAKNYKIVTVPVTAAEKNITTDSTFMRITDNNIAGTIKQTYKGYRAWDIGYTMMYYKDEERQKTVKKLTSRGSDRYIQNKYDVSQSDTGSKDISIAAAFSIDNYVQQAGRQYFVNMNLKHSFEDMRVTEENRQVPYYYDYKERTREVVVMDIPKGYRVTHLPAAAKGSVDGVWDYKISYKSDGKKVTLMKEYEVKALSTAPAQFAANNKSVDDLKKLYKESVVLTAN